MRSLVRLLALAASAVIALSLLMFTVDQSNEGRDTQLRTLQGQQGSATSQADLDQPNPPAAVERVREQERSSAREYIEDGNDILVSPFTGVVDSSSVWVNRLVPAALGLLLFGLGGLLLANWLPERSHAHKDWRQQGA